MCARIRAHEVVKDFFSHRFRDFMRATSLLDAWFCSLWWWCAKNEQLCTKCIEGRTNKKFSSFASKFKNPKYLRFETPPWKTLTEQRVKEGIKKRGRKDETFRFVCRFRGAFIYIINERTVRATPFLEVWEGVWENTLYLCVYKECHHHPRQSHQSGEK